MMPARLCCCLVLWFTVLAGRTLNASQRKEDGLVCHQEFCLEDNNEVRAGNSCHDLHAGQRKYSSALPYTARGGQHEVMVTNHV